MKRPKWQFGLAAIFVAMTIFGVVLSVYRHLEYVDERVHFHTFRTGSTNRSEGTDISLEVLLASREALLAGDEYRIEDLGRRFHVGQPMEIAYVPAQLIAVDNAITMRKDQQARREAEVKYHQEMAAEYEKSRWRPWHRIPDRPRPPEVLSRAEGVGNSGGLNPQLIPLVEK